MVTRWASVYEAFWKNFTHFFVFDTKHTIYELCLPSECGFGMSMDLADPVSSWKYSGTRVFTAPVAEPTVVLFTVPLNGCTIVATATIVTSCSSSIDCPGSAALFYEGVCVAMYCGGGFLTPDGAYDSVWDSVKLVTGNYFFNYFQYQEFVGCVCMLNYWFSSNDEILSRQLQLFPVQVEGQVSQ